MLNKKLKAIATLVDACDVVIDIGCDHAYLAIYLKENNLCKEVYASDISAKVLASALKNIKKSNTNIELYLSDGFKNIDNDHINTAIISGMGTSTILDIIKFAPENINKYIISSNNNHEELRTKMYQLSYYIEKEIVIKDKDKFYPIMLFTKEHVKESVISLKYGKSNNKEYFNYLIAKEKNILSNISGRNFLTKFKHIKKIKELQKLINKL